MTEQEIEFCLERLATCKTTDIMNFDYAGTLAYIQRLKAENVTLKARLDKALPCKIGDIIYTVTFSFSDGYNDCGDLVYRNGWHISETKVTQKNLYRMCELFSQRKAFFSRQAAEARLIEIINNEN